MGYLDQRAPECSLKVGDLLLWKEMEILLFVASPFNITIYPEALLLLCYPSSPWIL